MKILSALARLLFSQSFFDPLSDAPGDKQPGGLVLNVAVWQCLLELLDAGGGDPGSEDAQFFQDG